MRIALIISYAVLWGAFVYRLYRIRRRLPSTAWNLIAGGFGTLWVTRYATVMIVFLYPPSRVDIPDVWDWNNFLQIINHVGAHVGFLILIYGFYQIEAGLKYFFAPKQKTEPPQ